MRALFTTSGAVVDEPALCRALRGRVLPVSVPGGDVLVDLGDWTSLLIVRMGGWEPHLAKLCALRVGVGETALDLGAHNGAYTLLLSKLVGPAGRVVAFEPHPPSVNLLRTALGAVGNVRIEAAAVSDREGPAPFFAWQAASKDDRFPGADSMLHSLVRAEGYGAGETVAMITLDAWATRNHLARVDFLKIDVEGAELAVLHGGRDLLRSDGVRMLIELHPEELAATGASVVDVLKELHSQGFDVLDIVPAGDRLLLRPLDEGAAPTTHHVFAERGAEPFEVLLTG